MGRWRLRIATLGAAALLAGGLAASAEAAIFDSLYTVTVQGDAAARDARADAERRALAKVLTRITGGRRWEADPAVAALLEASDRYLSYRPLQPLPGNRWRFEFNAARVEQDLRGLGVAVWGPERPSTLLFVAAEFPSGNRAELTSDPAGGERPRLVIDQACDGVGGDADPVYASNPLSPDEIDWFEQVVGEILAACDERGLPVIVPRLDAEDRADLRFADVWGGVGGFVERAAARYAPDTILIARVEAQDRPIVNWTQIGGRPQAVTTESLRFGIDSLAEQYAAQLAIAGDAQLSWITIRDIQEWTDYGRVSEHCASISIVESCTPESISGTEHVFEVVHRGSAADLERYLTLSGDLRRVAPSPGSTGDGLVFEPGWRPARAPLPGGPP